MRLKRLRAAVASSLRELLRRRVVLLLIALLPSAFYGTTLAITTTKPVWFQLAAIEEEDYLSVPQRHEALVFVGLASVGVLAAFLALNLAQRDAAVYRRLVLCGYRPWELLLARLAVLGVVVAVVSTALAAVLPLVFRANRPAGVLAGFLLCGFVYAGYGLLVGALFQRELEGVLFVALLANLDVGWLQNPILYSQAAGKPLIHALPGFLPSQIALASSFSEHPPRALLGLALGALAYGLALSLAALFAHAWRNRSFATRRAPRGDAPTREEPS